MATHKPTASTSADYQPSPATELPTYNVVTVTEMHETSSVRSKKSHHSLSNADRNEKRVSSIHAGDKHADNDDDDEEEPSQFALFYRRFKPFFHVLIWSLITAFFVAAVVLHPERGWLPLSALYAFITLKMLFAYVPTSLITRPMARVWGPTVEHPWFKINRRIRYAIGFAIPIIIMLILALVQPESNTGTRVQRIISLCGLILIIGLLWATSKHRADVQWRIVIVGVMIQIILGLLILKTKAGYELFSWISQMASSFLGFSTAGAVFVLGESTVATHSFAVGVLPGVLFFASFIQIVYYLGGMQWVVRKFAFVMVRLMDTSGAESVVAAASPFVGQGESALLVKPFIKDMTLSEIHSTMTSGFSTIAGSVLIAFIGFGIEPQPLITACVMSVPCSLAVSKLRYPEKQESTSKGRVIIPKDEDRESNALHAAANGAAQGVHLILLIAGTLLAIISLLALVDGLVGWLGSFVGLVDLKLMDIARYAFVPFAWFIGIPNQDVMQVSNLMATKMFANEFVAYIALSKLKEQLTLRGQLLTSYALCGFANFASVGIQIGCIGAMAPSRKRDLARLALSAMLCGTMSTFITACIAGILL